MKIEIFRRLEQNWGHRSEGRKTQELHSRLLNGENDDTILTCKFVIVDPTGSAMNDVRSLIAHLFINAVSDLSVAKSVAPSVTFVGAGSYDQRSVNRASWGSEKCLSAYGRDRPADREQAYRILTDLQTSIEEFGQRAIRTSRGGKFD